MPGKSANTNVISFRLLKEFDEILEDLAGNSELNSPWSTSKSEIIHVALLEFLDDKEDKLVEKTRNLLKKWRKYKAW